MKGKFVVIEGTDGSGKAEQFSRLVRRLRGMRIPVHAVDFPRYGHPAAFFAERYLRGEYGPGRTQDPRVASFFYALDRFDASFEIRAALEKGFIVVANRYVASNMGHQGSKIRSRSKQQAFFRWVHKLEFTFFGIPKPDLNIILRVPPAIAYALIAKKERRAYLKGKKRDEHEADMNHLKRAAEAYTTLVHLFPREFSLIDCAPRGTFLSRGEVEERLWQVVGRILRIAR